MQESDVGRRCVVFDRPVNEGNGILGKIIAVFTPITFRFRSEPNERYPDGKVMELSMEGPLAVRVQFLDGDAR